MAPRIELETDNALAVLHLVAAELGVALLPRLALATLAVPAGVVIRPTIPSSDRSIQVVTQAGARRVPSIAIVLRELLELETARLGAEPRGLSALRDGAARLLRARKLEAWSEPSDGIRDPGDRLVDLVAGRLGAEREAHGGPGDIRVEPIASSTCDGSSLPAAQADPLEQTMPRCSSSSSTASPLVPGKAKAACPGSRCVAVRR